MAEIKTERLDGYRRLIDIARDLASTLDLDILLSRIVHAAAEISGAEAASILLYDDTSRQLYFQVSTNMDDATRRGIIVPLDGSIAGWIVNNRQTVRVTNAHEDPRFFSNVEETTGSYHGIAFGDSIGHKEQDRGCAGSLQQAQR